MNMDSQWSAEIFKSKKKDGGSGKSVRNSTMGGIAAGMLSQKYGQSTPAGISA